MRMPADFAEPGGVDFAADRAEPGGGVDLVPERAEPGGGEEREPEPAEPGGGDDLVAGARDFERSERGAVPRVDAGTAVPALAR